MVPEGKGYPTGHYVENGAASLTEVAAFASIRAMARAQKSSGGAGRGKTASKPKSKQHKEKKLPAHPAPRGGVEMVDPLVQAQMKVYEEAMGLFHQQKFQRAKQELEKVLQGPSKELGGSRHACICALWNSA